MFAPESNLIMSAGVSLLCIVVHGMRLNNSFTNLGLSQSHSEILACLTFSFLSLCHLFPLCPPLSFRAGVNSGGLNVRIVMAF